MRCFIKNKQKNWDVHLQQLAGAIRATKHRQTGFTPNQMMLGRDVVQPLDLLLGTVRANNPDKEPPVHIKTLSEVMIEVHKIARQNLKASQHRQKRDYDLRIRQHQYSVGDVVLKIDSATKVGQSSKLKSPWKGPYLITEVKSPVLYRIADRKGDSIIHHDRIKLCRDQEFPIWLRKLRDRILNAQPCIYVDERDDDNLGLTRLFSADTLELTSDTLMPGPSVKINNDNSMSTDRESVPDSPNLDVVSHVKIDSGQICQDTKRIRRRPGYLVDYELDTN